MNKKNDIKVAIFADQDVGFDSVKYIIDSHKSHLSFIVSVSNNEISELARSKDVPCYLYDEIKSGEYISLLKDVDYVFLAWWPFIIPENVINLPKGGMVNFHPSLLPYNRGKNYNFWTIVDESPFGVSMHFVDSGIDTGDIVFQREVQKTWEDTGGSLYVKAKKAIFDLFKDRYLDIVSDNFVRKPQNLEEGSFRYGNELNGASEISIDESYTARNLLNLLRARTFEGKPACFFYDAGKKYEIRVSIKEVVNVD